MRTTQLLYLLISALFCFETTQLKVINNCTSSHCCGDMADFFEWKIKNFSCWSSDIHNEYLQTCGVKLYPKGVRGKGEHLVVILENWPLGGVGELSLIASDGSVICTGRPDSNRIFTGPKFEKVVTGIRGNEPLHKDRLILRWETSQGLGPERSLTVIDAYSAFFQIKPDLDKHKLDPKKLDLENWNPIYNIYFRFRDENQLITLSACKTASTFEDTKIKFKLKSNAVKKILARTSIWMLNGDNIVQKHEDDCILDEGDSHVLPYRIPLKELQCLKTIMRCKIITGQSGQNIRCMARFPLLPDIKLTCFSSFCEIKSLGNVVVSDATKGSNLFPRKSQSENSVAALTKDLAYLWQNEEFVDFELQCGDVSFMTHQNILSARSPVLKDMLMSRKYHAVCVEGPIDVEVIEDLDPHTLSRFLTFLYSGTCADLEWEEALRLYYAAEKYLVLSLKEECAAVLRASVSLENVCDILSLADKYQDEELRSVTHGFILKNFNEVLGSKSWEKLIKSDPILVANTVTDIAKNKYIKVIITK